MTTVSLTYCSLIVSVTTCLMKKEKDRVQEEELHNPVMCLCVVLMGCLIYHSLWERHGRARGSSSEQCRGEGRQLQKKSKVVPPFPSPRKPTPLSKKTQPMTNSANCVHTESHDCCHDPAFPSVLAVFSRCGLVLC